MNDAETTNPIAHPLFSRGNSPPIKDTIIIETIARPMPAKRLVSNIVAKLWEKNMPNSATINIAIPRRNRDLCLNLMVKAPIKRPAIRPTQLTTNPIVLAVPIETPNVDAISGRRVLKKEIPEVARNEVISKTRRIQRLLKLLSA